MGWEERRGRSGGKDRKEKRKGGDERKGKGEGRGGLGHRERGWKGRVGMGMRGRGPNLGSSHRAAKILRPVLNQSINHNP